MEEESNGALIAKAIYRFARTRKIRYYRAERTRSGIEFLYPISVGGSRIVDTSSGGRDYVVLYLLTKWGKLAAGGYWLNPSDRSSRRHTSLMRHRPTWCWSPRASKTCPTRTCSSTTSSTATRSRSTWRCGAVRWNDGCGPGGTRGY